MFHVKFMTTKAKTVFKMSTYKPEKLNYCSEMSCFQSTHSRVDICGEESHFLFNKVSKPRSLKVKLPVTAKLTT